MSQAPDNSLPGEIKDQGGDAESPVFDRVQELTWAVIDEEITADEMRLLDSLLISDEAARKTYVGCMQMHTDLLSIFSGDPAKTPGTSASPVLGFLSDTALPFGMPPKPEDSRS